MLKWASHLSLGMENVTFTLMMLPVVWNDCREVIEAVLFCNDVLACGIMVSFHRKNDGIDGEICG